MNLKKLNVNTATAEKGLNALVDQSILYIKRDLGMFVTPEAKSIVIDKQRKQFEEKLLSEFFT